MAIAAESTAEQARDPAPHEPSKEPRKAPAQPARGGEDNELDFDEEEEELDGPAAEAARREKAWALYARLQAEPVGIRVIDIIIKGNHRTRRSLIEAEVADLLRSACTLQDLLGASKLARTQLRSLDVFDSVAITLDAGPPEFPGTTNVVIEVVEAARRFDGGIWSKAKEFDIRGAVPFGFYNAALNVGISAGVILPLGRGFMELSSPVPDTFYLGGHCSPVSNLCALSLLGFETRGVGPSEPQRSAPGESVTDHDAASTGRDYLGGDLAVSAFADLSFDLPVKLLKDTGIHGHAFLSAGNIAKLSESEYKNFSFPEFRRTFRSSAGVGIVWPTKLFRWEINYCYILKKFGHDCGKGGIQFSVGSRQGATSSDL